MKTFEERHAAYLDGKLSDAERADFEREAEQHPDTLRLRQFLRENPTSPTLSNPDFFNLQIQQRIAADQPRQKVRGWSWSIPRMVWAGAACLLMAGAMFKMVIPTGPQLLPGDASPYFAQVVESWPSDPSIYASTVYNPRDNLTVLWLDGLDYIPASYKIE